LPFSQKPFLLSSEKLVFHQRDTSSKKKKNLQFTWLPAQSTPYGYNPYLHSILNRKFASRCPVVLISAYEYNCGTKALKALVQYLNGNEEMKNCEDFGGRGENVDIASRWRD
jgi:hypothetical protein